MQNIKKTISFIILNLILILSLNITSTYAETNQGSPSQSATDSTTRPNAENQYQNENQQSYQQLRNSLIPKQTDFIQKSKNLDIDGDQKVSESEQKQILFTEGNVETQILPRILKIIIYSSILIFTGIFIYAGIILVISNGNETSYTEVKNLIVNTLIGVGVILGSYAIIYGIVTILQNLRR